MPTRIEIIEAEAMKLTLSERGDLADKLWLSVHSKEEVDASWDAEITRRRSEIDAGLDEGIPAEKVFAEMRALIDAHDPKV